MSDYSKTTNFTAKDALPTGNPSKTILGSEHDTEYTNIQTAIATKANKTGAPATTNNLAMLTATGDLADSLVETDGSGNISSNGTITGTTITASTGFTGDLTGDVTGNADTATTAANLSGSNLSGDVTNVDNAISLAANSVAADEIVDNSVTGTEIRTTAGTERTQSIGAGAAFTTASFADGPGWYIVHSLGEVFSVQDYMNGGWRTRATIVTAPELMFASADGLSRIFNGNGFAASIVYRRIIG